MYVFDGEGLVELSEANHQRRLADEKARWEKAKTKAGRVVERSDDDERWALRQALASPAHYYGAGGTIHQTGEINIETKDGVVVGAWFRCLLLPFTQTEVDQRRADELKPSSIISLTGVEYLDPEDDL